VDARVSAWTRQHTQADAAAKLGAAGVAAVPVLDAADRARDPRFARRQVVYRGAGMPVKGLPFLMHQHQVQPSLRAPALGEHTRAVLRDICGLSDPAIDDYHARGVIHCGSPGDTATTLPKPEAI
jgi:formyl-CoA transferase